MNYQTNIYEIQKNGRCKVDLDLTDLNLFISGFVVVPGPNGKGVIVHMPKGMGTDWQYKEIEWAYVRSIISSEYLKNPQICEILNSLFANKTQAERTLLLSTKAQNQDKPQVQVEPAELFVNLYNFDVKSGDCMAGIILPKSKIRIEGFKVKNDKTGGISVYMPKLLGTTWRYDEISWKNVRQKITQQYQKEREYVDTIRTTVQDRAGFVTEFHSCSTEYKYEISIHVINGNDDIAGFLFTKDEKIRLDIPSTGREMLREMGIEMKELAELSKKVFNDSLPVCDHRNLISIKIGGCIGQTVNTNVDFSLPNSEYIWKNFFMKQAEDGSIIVSLPSSLNKKWMNSRYPWNVLCDMLKSRFRTFLEDNSKEKIITVDETKDLNKKNKEDSIDIENETVEKKEETSEKKKHFLSLRNQMQRVRNAENTAFAFVPHSVLKLVDVSIDRKDLTRRIVNAINSPNGGIGPLEIEILEWVSTFKYVQKTMILDLVLSGYISLGERNSITANKMTDIMNRLYKYDLIESSNFVAVDDDGNPLADGGSSTYRVHTLGATGYNLLREMGRHPERRNPFGVLADGNTVKKHLSANQWLVYWLTHYAKGDILDYSVNTNINLIGLKWNGARIYASINLGTISIIAEPVRRCEDFEKESEVVAIQEKMLRVIELFDNEDQLYTSTREQIVYPIRPIISFVCEDDEHMEKVAECVKSIVEQYKQQEVWFTTDIRMFNYDCKGERFFELEDGKMTVVNLEEKVGLEEMSMEERGGWATEMQVN